MILYNGMTQARATVHENSKLENISTYLIYFKNPQMSDSLYFITKTDVKSHLIWGQGQPFLIMKHAYMLSNLAMFG